MANILSGVMTYGTGAGANISNGQWAGGKTGTSDNDKDKWFVGFTPYYAGGVWSGFDQTHKYGGISGNPSVTLWKKVMDSIHKDLPKATLKMPQGMVARTVCTISGNLAGEECETKRTDYFKNGTQPNAFCEGHPEEVPEEELTGEGTENTEGLDENAESNENAENTESNGNAEGEGIQKPPAEDVVITDSPDDGDNAWWGEE